MCELWHRHKIRPPFVYPVFERINNKSEGNVWYFNQRVTDVQAYLPLQMCSRWRVTETNLTAVLKQRLRNSIILDNNHNL